MGNWRDRAACGPETLKLFYGPDGEQWRNKQKREAKAVAICATCPVRAECLEAELQLAQPDAETEFRIFGVHGGLTEDEQTKIAIQRFRKPKAHEILAGQIRALEAQGMSRRHIMRQLNVSRNKVDRLAGPVKVTQSQRRAEWTAKASALSAEGWTPLGIARELGVHVTTVRKYLNGKAA